MRVEPQAAEERLLRGKRAASSSDSHIYKIYWQQWHITVMGSLWNKYVSASHARETT